LKFPEVVGALPDPLFAVCFKASPRVVLSEEDAFHVFLNP
jgi:hypothetical protein